MMFVFQMLISFILFCDEHESSSDARMNCQAAGRDWFVLRSMGAAVLFAFVSLEAGSLCNSD